MVAATATSPTAGHNATIEPLFVLPLLSSVSGDTTNYSVWRFEHSRLETSRHCDLSSASSCRRWFLRRMTQPGREPMKSRKLLPDHLACSFFSHQHRCRTKYEHRHSPNWGKSLMAKKILMSQTVMITFAYSEGHVSQALAGLRGTPWCSELQSMQISHATISCSSRERLLDMFCTKVNRRRGPHKAKSWFIKHVEVEVTRLPVLVVERSRSAVELNTTCINHNYRLPYHLTALPVTPTAV